MSPEETLRRVIEILEKHKIPYMLTGSVAASYHGRPRATHDADVAMVTPEDAILSKLEWAQRSGDSVTQLRDAAGVLELNPGVDRTYIERWAIELGVFEMWQAISKSRDTES